MQAIKEKISDFKEMRKAKAEAKEEEKAHKEIAKGRVEVAHEVRMAREAEAAMDLHVQKAAEKAVERERKFSPRPPMEGRADAVYGEDIYALDSHGRSANSTPPGYSADDPMYGGGASAASGRDAAFMDSTTLSGTQPTHKNLL